jgi:hypothetical protein
VAKAWLHIRQKAGCAVLSEIRKSFARHASNRVEYYETASNSMNAGHNGNPKLKEAEQNQSRK